MIRSMTAFASGERGTPWGVLGCELRSVNHRFLETGLRLADELRALEPVLRERVAARVQRGKLDLVMRLRAPESATSLAVNEPLLEQLGALAQRLDAKFPRLRVEFTQLLQLPGVLQVPTADGEALRVVAGSRLHSNVARTVDAGVVLYRCRRFGIVYIDQGDTGDAGRTGTKTDRTAEL